MADITLDDIMAAPSDQDSLQAHLLAKGYIQPPAPPPEPAPTVAPAEVSTPLSPVTPKSDVAPMRRPARYDAPAGDPALTRGENLTPPDIDVTPPVAPTLSPVTEPRRPEAPVPALNAAVPSAAVAKMSPIEPAPEIAGKPMESPTGISVAPMTPPVAPTKQESQAAGKYEYNLNRPVVNPADPIEKQEATRRLQIAYDREHPLGSDVSRMPGTKGKILHTLGEIGQIAGGAIAPGVIEQIPGTERNRQLQDRELASDIVQREGANNAAKRTEAETALQGAETKTAEAKLAREGTEQSLEKDAEGNITGWKDGKGELHSLDEEGTPQAIKDIADANQNKPHFEKSTNGDIVQITPGKNGAAATSNVVYKGQPGIKTETRSIIGPDGHAHDHVVDITPGSPTFGKSLADLGRTKEDKVESPTAAIAKDKANERVVLAYDKDGKQHLMSKADADAEGMTHITAASPGDIDKAKTHHVVLNTLQTQLNSVVDNSKALDQNIGQRAIIASALAHPSNTTIDSLFRAGVLAGATEETKNYVQSVLALREAGLALPKEITGGSRVAEIQASALWATMPGAGSLDSKYAIKQAKKFQQDIDRLRERAPEVRGQSIVDPNEAIQTKGEKQHTAGASNAGAKQEAPAPPAGKSVVYDENHQPHFVNTSKLDDFLKDPKYKNWTKK